MDPCLYVPAGSCLYSDLSTSCYYYHSNETSYTRIPESTLDSIHSSNNCTWLKGIVSNKKYTTQDVWRDLLPATIFEPNSTNCYGDQYMNYFGLDSAYDKQYSYWRNGLIPRGLSSLTDQCVVKVCQGIGAAGNPDMTGIGMLVAYGFELSFILLFYLSRLKGDGSDDNAPDNATTFKERLRSPFETHNRAVRQTTPQFLDVAIFFAISIAIGSIATGTSPEITGYERTVLLYVSLLVAFPLYTILALSWGTLRRERLRRNLASLVAILLFTGWFVALMRSDSDRDRWGVICLMDESGGYNFASATAQWIGFIAFIAESIRLSFWLTRLAVKKCRPSWGQSIKTLAESQKRGINCCCWHSLLRFVNKYIYHWASQERTTWLVATCGIGSTGLAIGCLAYVRFRMQKLAGDSYKESEMTYGQYLAAFIWLPVLVEYVLHWRCEYRHAAYMKLGDQG